MNKIITILCSVFLFATQALANDYSNIEPSYFDKYENNHVFTDDKGHDIRVKNTRLNKGLYIKINGEWLKHGAHYRYRGDGKLLTRITFNKNIKNGSFKQYHPDGSLCFDYNYLNNKRHGVYYQYRDNDYKNTVFNKFNYVDGMKQGKAYRYDNLGRISREYNYLNDRRHGEAITYNPETGEIATTLLYNNGALQLDSRELLAN